MKVKKTPGQKRPVFCDIHMHIIPGVDDGAKTLAESIKMAEIAYAQGVRCICATPHYEFGCKQDLYKLTKSFETLKDSVHKRWPDMLLFLGNEILYSYGVAEDVVSGKALSYNRGRYILIEFYPQESYQNIFEAIQAFACRGYTCVIAHVERIDCLWKQWQRLDELKDMHALLQMNTDSIVGSRFNGAVRYCRQLISEGYIDLLSTDAHNCTDRAPLYDKAADWILKFCGDDELKRLTCINPAKILS